VSHYRYSVCNEYRTNVLAPLLLFRAKKPQPVFLEHSVLKLIEFGVKGHFI
jgi:hypothetical protein